MEPPLRFQRLIGRHYGQKEHPHMSIISIIVAAIGIIVYGAVTKSSTVR